MGTVAAARSAVAGGSGNYNAVRSAAPLGTLLQYNVPDPENFARLLPVHG